MGGDPWPVATDSAAFASPVRADGTVYVRDAGGIRAIDAQDGNQAWQRGVATESAGGESFDGSPAVASGRVVAGAADALVALDATTGDPDWRVGVDPVDGGDRVRGVYGPAVADGTVYAGSADGRFRAVDAETARSRRSGADSSG